MGTRHTDRAPYKAIAIPSDRITVGHLTEQGAGLTDSSYSQAGPRPGVAVTTDPRAKLIPQISGAQEVGIEVQVRRAGLPEREGVGLVWREEGSSDDFAWRDQAPPTLANHWIAAEWTDADTYDVFDLISVPGTGALLLVYADSSDPAGSLWCRRFEFPAVNEATNPQTAPTETAQWSDPRTRVSVNPNAPSGRDEFGWTWVTGLALPNGRVLVFGNVPSIRQFAYYSDDGGVTWAPYALPHTGELLVSRARCCFYRGELLLLDSDEGTAPHGYEQLASKSLGATFDEVEVSVITDINWGASVEAIPGDGGIAIAYTRTADDFPIVRVLSSAYQPLSTATEVVVENVACESLELVSDPTGRLWVFGRLASSDEVRVWVSTDGGATWDVVTRDGVSAGPLFVSHDAAGARIVNFAAAFCRGWVVIAHNWTAAVGNEDGSIGTLWSAGWGTVSVNSANTVLFDSVLRTRPGWPQTATGASTSQSAIGIPIELPADVGPWVNALTVAPTLEAPGVLQFALVAQNGVIQLDPAGTAGSEHAVLFEMKIAAGAADATQLQAGMDLRIADNTVDFHVEIRLDNTGAGKVRIYDNGAAATIVDVDPWDVEEWTQFLVAIDADGHLVVALRRPWHTRWLEGVVLEDATTLTDAGAGTATNRIRIGSVSACTATLHVRQWHHAQKYFGQNALSFGVREPDLSDMYHRIGGLVSPFPEPLPEVGEQGEHEAFIAAARGPGRQGDLYRITPIYDYGVDRLFPAISPSPAEPWRSSNLDEQVFTFDMEQNTRLGPVWHWLVALLNTNVRTLEIAAKTNAAGAFTPIVTYNGAEGFEGLTFERNGDWIRPAAGTIDAARFLDRNSLAGGYAILDTAGTPVALRVDANSAGGWTDPSATDTMLAGVRLVGVDGGTPSSGLCDLVFPDGYIPVAFTTDNPPTQFYRYFQVTIPVQDVPEAYYQIGALFVGTTGVFGKRWSRGWSQSMIPNTARRASRYGVVRKRKDGPPARRWSIAWPDGVIRRRLVAAGVNPDFIADGAQDVAIAALDDVLGTLWAMLEETDGTERPVVALNGLVTADGTVTDRLRFLYGTLDGNAQWNNVVGEEVDGDFGRMDPIAVSELTK